MLATGRTVSSQALMWKKCPPPFAPPPPPPPLPPSYRRSSRLLHPCCTFTLPDYYVPQSGARYVTFGCRIFELIMRDECDLHLSFCDMIVLFAATKVNDRTINHEPLNQKTYHTRRQFCSSSICSYDGALIHF
jgi:hypothetical protein